MYLGTQEIHILIYDSTNRMEYEQNPKHAIDMRMNTHDVAAQTTCATTLVSYALCHQSWHTLTKVNIPERMAPRSLTFMYEAREHPSLVANA